MNVVWRLERATVPEVLARLERERELAYTTVMTVLSRLVDKGLLGREKEGRFYVYYPRVDREEVAESALRRVVDRFFDGVGHRAVAHLLDAGEDLEEDELRRLEELVRRARERKS